MKVHRLFTWSAVLLGSTIICRAGDLTRHPDRTHWPEALQRVPLEHLSSGALLRLDAGGDLVESPDAWRARTGNRSRENASASAVALDPRVGSNIRLGDDPAALPPDRRAQAEPHIIRSPINLEYLIATFQEGRFENGSAVNCGYSVSRDGGFTWTRALIPGLTPSSGGPYPRATDPVAGVAPSGNSYLNTLSAGSPTVAGSVLVSRSSDGTNFNAPRVAYQGPTPNDFPDKNWMAINTFPGTPSAGRILVTFTLFDASLTGPYPIARVFSDNGGETWSPLALIHSSNRRVQGSQPAFLPDGRLVVVYWNFNNTDDFSDDFLEMVLSTDGGVTFGAPKFIRAMNYYDAPSVRDGGFLPSVAVDRSSGAILVVYQALQAGVPRIMFIKSTDAGNSWSAPVAVSDNPGSSVFNAAISASADGQRLAVVFYDTRNHPGSTTLVDLYSAQSLNGGTTWEPNLRVSSASTDATLAPLTSGGYMLGDYQAVAEPTNSITPAVPVWIDTRTGNPDPFTARVRIIPPFAPAPQADFNSDGNTDIIWQNNSTGQRAVWFMNRTTWVGERFLPVVETAWQIVGTGDFNGDHQRDILWQNNSTGQRAVWHMNGTTHIGERFLPTIPPEWQIAGTGDFNGDAKVDIVWQNISTGQRALWFMDGTAHIGERFLPTIALEWEIAAVADFNRDGQTDLLWQNRVTGQRAIWLMNGAAQVGERFLPTIELAWRIAGAGDFNGDGQTDILWQNTSTGQRAIWLMEETNWVAESFLPAVTLEWEIRNR